MAKISPILLLGAGALAVVALSGKKKKKGAPLVNAEIQLFQVNLTILGYYSGDMDGEMNPVFKASIAVFQKDAGIPVTGLLDKQTRDGIISAIKLKGYMAQVAAKADELGESVKALLDKWFGEGG